MVEDRRQLKRRHLIFYLRVFDIKTNKLLGHLVDITPQGVMLISEKTIPLNTDFELKMALPSKSGQMHAFNFKARSLWCDKDINPDFYDTGFQLTDIDHEDRKIIEDLIEDFGFRD